MPNLFNTQDSSDEKRHDAYDESRPLLMSCSCGKGHTLNDSTTCHVSSSARSVEQTSMDYMEAAFVKALFPVDTVRRNFLKAVGVNTARAAISSVMPLGALHAMAE